MSACKKEKTMYEWMHACMNVRIYVWMNEFHLSFRYSIILSFVDSLIPNSFLHSFIHIFIHEAIHFLHAFVNSYHQIVLNLLSTRVKLAYRCRKQNCSCGWNDPSWHKEVMPITNGRRKWLADCWDCALWCINKSIRHCSALLMNKLLSWDHRRMDNVLPADYVDAYYSAWWIRMQTGVTHIPFIIAVKRVALKPKKIDLHTSWPFSSLKRWFLCFH